MKEPDKTIRKKTGVMEAEKRQRLHLNFGNRKSQENYTSEKCWRRDE